MVPSSPVGNQFSTIAAAAAVQEQERHGGGGHGHGAVKKSGLDGVQNAAEKAALNVESQRKTIEQRKAEIERMRELFRQQSERVGEKNKDNPRQAILVRALSAQFEEFVHAVGSAFVASGYGVQLLVVNGCCATIAAFISEGAAPDGINFLLWEDAGDSKIGILIDRSDGWTAPPIEVLPPFTEDKGRDAATQVILTLKG